MREEGIKKLLRENILRKGKEKTHFLIGVEGKDLLLLQKLKDFGILHHFSKQGGVNGSSCDVS